MLRLSQLRLEFRFFATVSGTAFRSKEALAMGISTQEYVLLRKLRQEALSVGYPPIAWRNLLSRSCLRGFRG